MWVGRVVRPHQEPHPIFPLRMKPIGTLNSSPGSIMAHGTTTPAEMPPALLLHFCRCSLSPEPLVAPHVGVQPPIFRLDTRMFPRSWCEARSTRTPSTSAATIQWSRRLSQASPFLGLGAADETALQQAVHAALWLRQFFCLSLTLNQTNGTLHDLLCVEYRLNANHACCPLSASGMVYPLARS